VSPPTSGQAAESAACAVYVRPGFQWRDAHCFLFDIDGTLLNTRDGVQYHAFSHAFREVWKIEETIDGVPWHGNTDIGIIRGVAARAGIAEDALALDALCRVMSEEIARTRERLKPTACPAIPTLVGELRAEGKLLGVATGNIEAIGWAKLENCGLRDYFAFGAFSARGCETREAIFERAVTLAHRHLQDFAPPLIHVVGDTPSDIRAARAVGLPIIAVATGKFGYEDLLSHAPDMLLGCWGDIEGVLPYPSV
jgi:phosphoglycolate phosphatase